MCINIHIYIYIYHIYIYICIYLHTHTILGTWTLVRVHESRDVGRYGPAPFRALDEGECPKP